MKILAIDTSATAASVAISEKNKVIGEFFINTSLTHSQTLMPMIEQLLKSTQLSLDDIDAIAINAGPGSFTGVRIGVAAAKGLAFAKDSPCISVSTLHSMAYNMQGNDCIVCAVMDARCSQVYNALFRINGNTVERITEDRAISLQDLKLDIEKYSEKIILVGDGAEITKTYLGNEFDNVELASANNRVQRAASTALAGFELYNNKEVVSCEQLMPIYLRLPQAQRELNKRLNINS